MLRQCRKQVRRIAALPRMHAAALQLHVAINWARRMFFKRDMQQLHRHPQMRKKACVQILRGRNATPTCQRSQRHDSCVIYVCIINMRHLHISATPHGRLARRRLARVQASLNEYMHQPWSLGSPKTAAMTPTNQHMQTVSIIDPLPYSGLRRRRSPPGCQRRWVCARSYST